MVGCVGGQGGLLMAAPGMLRVALCVPPVTGPPAARPLCAASKRQQERAEREAARAEREANRIELDENDEAMVVPTDADRDFIDDEVRWPTCIQLAMRAACHAMPR